MESRGRIDAVLAGLDMTFWQGTANFVPLTPSRYGKHYGEEYRVYFTPIPVGDGQYGTPGYFDIFPVRVNDWLRAFYGGWW